MVTTTTITVTVKGNRHPGYIRTVYRRLTEDEVHEIVQNDALIGYDPAKVDVHIFFETKAS